MKGIWHHPLDGGTEWLKSAMLWKIKILTLYLVQTWFQDPASVPRPTKLKEAAYYWFAL